MSSRCPESDQLSLFSYDDPDTISESFSLQMLKNAVSEHFRTTCKLIKLAEGGYHKVYDVVDITTGTSLDAVVRVASSAFPRDKLLSEIATLRYIATHTNVPVPEVYAWDADSTNPVGAEYMIMQKIPGISAHGDKWKSLPLKVKCNVVKQVAAHLATLFSQRFEQAGSLYFAGDRDLTRFKVGPIVSLPFYRMIDGVVEHPDMPLDVRETLNSLRGPYKSTSDYLANHLRAELLKMDRFRPAVLSSLCSDDAVPMFEKAQGVMRSAVELCYSYPGDRTVPPKISTPDRPYTFMLDDFRLANILIDENTGHVNGYVDFEATTLVPLWQSATVPQWVPDPDSEMAGWYGGTPRDQRELWSTFHKIIDHSDHGLTGGEWRKAYEAGKHFRDFADRIRMGIPYWANEMENRVKDRMEWAQQHPGVGMPDKGWDFI